MNKIGSNNEDMLSSFYREWPVFQKVSKNTSFVETYEQIFDEKFQYIEYDSDKLKDIGATRDKEDNLIINEKEEE